MNYFAGSGSYGCKDSHYFISHMYDQPKYVEYLNEHEDGQSINLLYEMGEYQYEFSYETIRDDYIKYSGDTELLNIKTDIYCMMEGDITRDTFRQIRARIDNFLEKDAEQNATINPELDKYYKLCRKYYGEYESVRIIFGYDP